jgi:hypothetical protein
LTRISETTEFRRQLRATVEAFGRHEALLRDQYAREIDGSGFPRELLERPTRRFLIDGLLRALGWNVDDPQQVVEEARARTATGDRLYFDYLGVSTQNRAPVLLFEAKGFDVPLPRRPRGPDLDARDMAELIANGVDALRQGDKTRPVISEWSEFLRDLYTYLSSLDELGRASLQRAVITAGGWLIVFCDPVATFLGGKPANGASIICFISIDDMWSRAESLYELLARGILIDALPFTLKVPEAIGLLSVRDIGPCFRAVLVATTTKAGARRQHHPVRFVYAALVVQSGGRWFAIVDYDRPVQEPKRLDSIAAFISELNERGSALLSRLGRMFAWELRLEPLNQFPGFSGPSVEAENDPAASGLGPSLVLPASATKLVREFVRDSGETGTFDEFIIVTGDVWFYKADRSVNTTCEFHEWRAARAQQVAAPAAHLGWLADSFTEDGQLRHCAHGDFHNARAIRCHIRPVETHMCCRTCVFAFDCWSKSVVVPPCPSIPDV